MKRSHQKLRDEIKKEINLRLDSGEYWDGKLHIFNNGVFEMKTKLKPKGFIEGRLPFSEETRNKQSISAKKRGPNNKDRKFSDKARKNMSDAKQKFLKENPDWESPTQFKPGQEPWNKGLTKETDERVAIMAEHYKEARPKGYHYDEYTRIEKLRKERDTKLKNGTSRSSKPEDQLYNILCGFFGDEDVERDYNKDDRYPFKCDFYIKSEDLFIELNLTWMHGEHPFDKTNNDDLDKLKIWKEKMIKNNSSQYKSAINCWTISDIKKQCLAKDNKLNYIMIYNKEDTHDFIRRIQKYSFKKQCWIPR